MSRTRITEMSDLSFDEFDEIHYPRPLETDFGRLVERAVSRRGFLGGGVAFGAAAFVAGAGALRPFTARAADDPFGFEAVAANTLDTVTVPPGYNWHIVAKWGEPMWSNGVEFDHMTRGTGESQELAFGDNNDGMSLFTRDGRNVLAVNNEYVNRKIIYGGSGSGSPENVDDVRKGKAGHGVSVVEIARKDGAWSIAKDSSYNRRITADTPMEITGPARGHDLLKTAADPEGVSSLGTWNNCGNGRTPWGTYLACEENFNGYFSSSDPEIEIGPAFKRYGVGPKDWGYAWAMGDRPRVQALRRRPQGLGIRVGDGASASTSRSTPTSPIVVATSSRSTRWTRRRPRRSAPPSVASSTRTRRRSSPPTGRWSSTWATTSGVNSSTSS